ncbi:MAG: hypothetical protein ACI3YT_11175, partial [Prevotella sp.]
PPTAGGRGGGGENTHNTQGLHPVLIYVALTGLLRANITELLAIISEKMLKDLQISRFFVTFAEKLPKRQDSAYEETPLLDP